MSTWKLPIGRVQVLAATQAKSPFRSLALHQFVARPYKPLLPSSSYLLSSPLLRPREIKEIAISFLDHPFILFIDRRRRVATMMRLGGRNLVRRFSRLAAAAETTPAAAAAAAVPRMPAFDHVPLPYDGPSAAEITRKRAEYLSPSLFHFYSKPVRRSIQPRTHLE
jgi:hypothetical protein